jgi:hypothetical protein
MTFSDGLATPDIQLACSLVAIEYDSPGAARPARACIRVRALTRMP